MLLMAGVQFVNVLDFMMVSPLGPRFAEALHVPTSEIAMVAGSYTLSASVTGVLGSFFLERFDRKRALVVCLIGLALGTALGGIAVGKTSLILARLVAGAFGGPATSLAVAIIADAIPTARRGWAIGTVMGGFAVASVIGVPMGLWFANVGGWRMPFFATGVLILIAAGFAMRELPPLRDHLLRAPPAGGVARALLILVRKPMVQLSFFLTTMTMMSGFILIPNLPSIVQYNLGFPAERLDLMYLLGGIASFATARIGGQLVDRFGSTQVAALGTLIFAVVVVLTFIVGALVVPVLVLTTVFFVAMAFRMVAYNTLTSKVPEPAERARFQSLQSAVQHAASAVGAFASTKLLSEWTGSPSGTAPLAVVPRGTGIGEVTSTIVAAVVNGIVSTRKLLSVERVAWASIGLGLTIPLTMIFVERALRRRASRSLPPPP